MTETPEQLHIGWAQQDITPKEPVLLRGQHHARVSEGVRDPLTVTALALDGGQVHAVLVSCDIIGIPGELVAAVRKRVTGIEGLDPESIVLNATHTHTAPVIPSYFTARNSPQDKDDTFWGIDLPVMDPHRYADFVADRIAKAVAEAWSRRQPGSIAFGLGQAVTSRNRRSVRTDGTSKMYGALDSETFDHIEGYEDQNVGVVATYDSDDNLSGMILNVACPAQVDEQSYEISADFWHEVRIALRLRYSENLYILGQCSAAGDLAPQRMGSRRYTYDCKAEARMLELRNCNERQQIAARLARVVSEILPVISPVREPMPLFRHEVITVELPVNKITPGQADEARADLDKFTTLYEQEKRQIDDNPELKKEPRWYLPVTKAYRMMQRNEKALQRFEQQSKAAAIPFEIHILRLGDMALATNPVEYYLDFGIQIKARSPAEQTFLVQLAGPGTYIPSARSVEGGGYGSIPTSNTIGPEGGAVLREETLKTLNTLWINE